MLKTICWAFCVASKFSEGPKALERRFSSRRDHLRDAPLVLTNSWKGYCYGRHGPRQRVLAAVSEMCPEASACWGSLLWTVLGEACLSVRRIRSLLCKLDSDVQVPAMRARRSVTVCPVAAAMLERRAGLDALAAALLLLRLAHLEQRQAAAFGWGTNVWRLMVLLGPMLVCGGIAQALSDLIEERFMPMAELDGRRPGFPAGNYRRVLSAYVEVMFHATRRSTPRLTERQLVVVGRQVLDGMYGDDCRWALNPVAMVQSKNRTTDVSLKNPSNDRTADERVNLHHWGLNVLQLGGHRGPPPGAACSGNDLWAIDDDDPYALLDPGAKRVEVGEGSTATTKQ
ncbi:hypothetical protein [Roseateles sp.]|uniref:hypothetical protein n=1 Tax=Roseateles sp. TaxID=1971397 RepID=UPI002F3F0169